MLRASLALALLTVSSVASADDATEAPPPPEPAATTHSYVEARLGAVGLQPLGSNDGGALRYGGAFELAAGIGFRWLDVGLAARYGTVPGDREARMSYGAFGPEVALRKSLGSGATLRVGVVPLYAIAWDATGARSRIGIDGLAQVLFTLDNKSRPAWRAGVGIRAGRWATISADDPGYTIGVDLLVRSWW